ncbi:DNA-protecting protein DprA [Butyrivibrio sp. CB08]|uniref:DNA-processing protein DprA n=1 Tax=Butyrivibrio sp. CB08 TaxID=2364879 RepID=UPI000EA8B4AF|nr:DNA-processing protein DprA [Butyrivibrio sp. CB08]RKM61290.1 DNA-protecting protein DprA [Butyrivibrio sp. CB08]
MEITEKDYALWLFNVEGIGNASADKLLCGGLSCRDVYQMSSKELSKILSQKQVLSIERSRHNWDFEREKKKLKEKGIQFISRIDPIFPEKLKNIPNAPFAIYVKGRLPDPGVPAVSIVGARMCSDYGRMMARQFGRDLAMAGVQVISGMARGVDGIAQNAALSVGGTSFGVLGCGVDICYPPENKEIYDSLVINGGIISEYPPGMEPIANFFPMRNRIISALSDVLLVVEARKKSGTQITVDTALEQGREVFAVPGRASDRLSDGCNFLISQGAGVAISAEDVLDRLWTIKGERSSSHSSDTKAGEAMKDGCFEDLDPELLETEMRELTIEEEILGILDIIPVSTSFILEELYKKGKEIPVPVLMSTLMELTYSGKIAQNGAYYRKIA